MSDDDGGAAWLAAQPLEYQQAVQMQTITYLIEQAWAVSKWNPESPRYEGDA